MGKLFGTDGIRGVANEYPMTAEMAVNVGRAVASFFGHSSGAVGNIIVGRDTRISGDMMASALAAGINSVGMNAMLAGVLPTPGVSFLTRTLRANAGIMVSASHNPYFDNGIKVFGPDGCKLSDQAEVELEANLLDTDWDRFCKKIRDVGHVVQKEDATKDYEAFLLNTVPHDFSLKGMRIVLDCANGATFKSAPTVYRKLGAEVKLLFTEPDGKNINDQCGSQHPEILAETVVASHAQVGLAFDGDGDRLIVVDEKGGVLTGDRIVAICARHMKEKGDLANNTVVTTIMSNLGLRLAMDHLGITHLEADVGDRQVYQMMKKNGAVLGGEDSGHMIFLNHHTTGDGLLSSLQLLSAIKDDKSPLSEIKKIMSVYPQHLINVEVSQKPLITEIKAIQNIIERVESELKEEGRVLVRYSGTQPICRVMVEGPTMEKTRAACEEIAAVVRRTIGGEMGSRVQGQR